jgi:sec-independent protein translocase protein TatA
MGNLSIWHWLIVLAIVLLLFGGRGKLSQCMGDFGKGLAALKNAAGAKQETPLPPAGELGDDTGQATASEGGVHRSEATGT